MNRCAILWTLIIYSEILVYAILESTRASITHRNFNFVVIVKHRWTLIDVNFAACYRDTRNIYVQVSGFHEIAECSEVDYLASTSLHSVSRRDPHKWPSEYIITSCIFDIYDIADMLFILYNYVHEVQTN